MNILIFGKNGQLGKAFKSLFYSLPMPKELNIQYIGRTDCDLSNDIALEALLQEQKPNLIINASAYTAVDKAESDIESAYAVNARAPELMAIYAAKNDATFLHYSTDYVFDGKKEGFYIESDIRNPLGIYGKSKTSGEEAIEGVFANATHGQFAILRTSWVYGDGGNFIRRILRLAKEREELKIIHDQHGVPTSADWLAKVGLALVLNQDFSFRSFKSGIYHATPPGETTWHGLASVAIEVARDAGVQLQVKPGAIKPILAIEYQLPAPRPMNSRLDSAKLRKVIVEGGDMSKLASFNQPWLIGVQEYVKKLAQQGLI